MRRGWVLVKIVTGNQGQNRLCFVKDEMTTVKKEKGKKINSFEMWCWRTALQIPRTTRKADEWVLNQVKPQLSLELKIGKLRLSYDAHTV